MRQRKVAAFPSSFWLFPLSLSLLASIADGHWMENNLLGPTCAGNIVEYSNVPDYDNAVGDCDHEIGHCKPLCILSKLGMMNTDGIFLPQNFKPILQLLLPPLKNRFRATELTGAYESCSLSFNFNHHLGVKHGCHSYADLLDCFRKSSLVICEGIKGPEITPDMGNASVPWPPAFMRPGDTNMNHSTQAVFPVLPSYSQPQGQDPQQPPQPQPIPPPPQAPYAPQQPQPPNAPQAPNPQGQPPQNTGIGGLYGPQLGNPWRPSQFPPPQQQQGPPPQGQYQGPFPIQMQQPPFPPQQQYPYQSQQPFNNNNGPQPRPQFPYQQQQQPSYNGGSPPMMPMMMPQQQPPQNNMQYSSPYQNRPMPPTRY